MFKRITHGLGVVCAAILVLVACSPATPPIKVVTPSPAPVATTAPVASPTQAAPAPTTAPTQAPAAPAATNVPATTAPTTAAAAPTTAAAAPTTAAATTSGAAQACPASTVADAKNVKGKYPQQLELAELEKAAGCKLKFTDNPLFAKDVTAKSLPAVDQRLPAEPLVVQPYKEIGKYGGTLRGLSIAPSSGTTDFFSLRLATLVVMQDDLHTIVPNVAKSWQVNADYTEWTFTLRKGHKWSDGQPFTTDDIVFWYEDYILNKELNPTVPSPWLVGGAAAKLTKIDDVSFKWTFAKPVPGLLTILSITPNEPWAPKHAVTKYHLKYNAQANAQAQAAGFKTWVEYFGTYFNKWPDLMDKPEVPTLDSHMLKEAPNTERRTRVANPYYYKVDTAGQQLPYIDTQLETFISDKQLINLKIMNGEVDFKAQSLDFTSYPLFKENETKGNYTVQLPPGFGGMIYAFNVTHPDAVLRKIFQDVRFKQAMSLAINRDEINKLLYFGLAKPSQAVPSPKTSFVEASMVSYMAQYDLAKANALLDEMGLKKGSDGIRLRPDGKPLSILLEYAQQAENVKNNELVKEYWEKAGVKVELKELTTEALRARSATNTQDVGVWSYTFYHEPSMIGNPRRLYPTWGDGSQQMTGSPWYKWYTSKGAEGEEPPADVKKLFELVEQWNVTVPGSDQYVKLGKEMMQLNLNNLFLIGTVGEIPGPTVVSKKLNNVPQFTVQSSDFTRALPFRVDQWFFK